MGDSMKKYAILVIAILALVVFASGCTTTNTYSEDGVSFNYPDGWQQLTDIKNTNAVAGFGDGDTLDSSTGNVNTVVIIQKTAMPKGFTLKQAFDATINQIASQDSSFKKISAKKVTVNGTTAYEAVYKIKVSGVQKQERSVWFEKEGYIYAVTASSLPSDFNSEQENFDVIINSFKVE